MSSPAPKPYISQGRVLSSPPLTTQIKHFFTQAYIFLGLYVVSLFSLDPYSAAERSSFNVRNREQWRPSSSSHAARRVGGGRPSRWTWGWGGGSGGGGGGGGGGPGGGPGGAGGGKRMGKIDDVREPECRSCT